MMIAVPVIMFLSCSKEDPNRPTFKKSLERWCVAIILVFTTVNTLCVMGVDEVTIGVAKSYAHLLYLVIGAMIVWRIYNTLLDRISEGIRKRDQDKDNRFDAFRPLFIYLGEIII